MGERVLRGSRLGATSYETESTADLAPREDVLFDCPVGHTFIVVMATEADMPYKWDCKVCGKPAIRRAAVEPEAKATKHVRTHWDMLLERRTIADLEEVLAERLALLRGGSQGDALETLRKAS